MPHTPRNRLNPRRSSTPARRKKQAANRRRENRRLLVEGLEDRNLMAFNFLADYATGFNPVDLALTSINPGSQPDMVVADNGSASVSVRLGSAGGTFGGLQGGPTGAGPISVAAGDIDGDLLADLVTVNASEISLLLGNGDGSFDAPTSLGLPAQSPPGYTGDPLPQSTLSVATGDLNADGKLDLVVGGQTSYSVYQTGYWCGYYGCYPYGFWQTYSDGYVNVLLGNGTGTFGAPATHHLGRNTYPTAVAIGDVNADLKPDVVAADGNGLGVLLGNGSGAVGSPSHSGSGYPLRSLSLGDVDGDNKVDALLNSGWGLTVQKGNGLGGFTAQPTLNTGIAVNSAVMGDVNADGKLDLVAAGSQNSSHCTSYGYDPSWGYPYCNAWTYTNTPQASVLVGNGLGAFALPLTSSIAAESDGYGYLGDVVVADLTGDSRPELVTIDYYAGKAIVAANDGDWNPPPSIVISDAAIVTEGNSGSVNAVFTVSIVGSHHGLDVTYQTADSSASSGSDYTSKTGTLTFAAGVETMTISVPVLGDTRDEIDEQFVVNLTGVTAGQITDWQAIGTIQDDDPTPTLTINDVSKSEGNNNLTLFVFTVTLSAASGQMVSVNFTTANGTATTADGDYVFTSGTVYLSPGQTTATITVQVRGGRSKEPNETFFVNLSGANNATISDGQGLGTILNDDNPKGPKSRR